MTGQVRRTWVIPSTDLTAAQRVAEAAGEFNLFSVEVTVGEESARIASGWIKSTSPLLLDSEEMKAALPGVAAADIDALFVRMDRTDPRRVDPRRRIVEIETEQANAAGAEPWDSRQAYAVGDFATFNGETVVNMIPGNRFRPDAAGWRGAWTQGGGRPAWRQLFGGVGFKVGAEVTHKGKDWRNTREVNVWEPGTSDSGWEEIGGNANGGQWIPLQEWSVGDVVTFSGSRYRCLQAHRNFNPAFTPPITPALWELLP